MPYLYKDKWRLQTWVNGQRYSKTFPSGTSKKIVDEYERKLKLSQIDPELADKRRLEPLFVDYAGSWIKNHCEIYHSYSYTLKCRQTIVLHLNPVFGQKKLRDIKSCDVQEFQKTLKESGYAIQSISNVLATLSSIFKQALADELLETNPCSGIKRLKKGQRPEFEVWTVEERDRFLALLYERNFAYFQACAVALFTGMRPSELRGLLRDAVDFEQCQIRVHRQWCTKQNKLVPYTKTRDARTVPIPKLVLESLTDKRSLPGDKQLFPFLINSFGHLRLKPLMVEADVKPIRMHDFRHTFASQMIFKGASLMEVKELLGHRKLESTAIYLHYMPDRNIGATDKLLGANPWLPSSKKIVSISR